METESSKFALQNRKENPLIWAIWLAVFSWGLSSLIWFFTRGVKKWESGCVSGYAGHVVGLCRGWEAVAALKGMISDFLSISSPFILLFLIVGFYLGIELFYQKKSNFYLQPFIG